jgi:hypothetical protein
MALPTRKIGADSVTAIGFGLMGMSKWYGPLESDESRLKVRAAYLWQYYGITHGFVAVLG